MLSIALRFPATALCLLLASGGIALAQSEAAAPAPESEKAAPTGPSAAQTPIPAPAPATGSIEETRPSVYYLPDKQGRLQPVLDFPYQDFVDLYKLKNQIERRGEPPRYLLQRMAASGVVQNGMAELTVRFQVVVRDDDWVRIPLRLDQGLLRGAAQYNGSGEQLVAHDDEGKGYVCWLRGKPDSQHEIVLTLLAPIVTMADENMLPLYLPRAAASELRLTVPLAAAVGKVPEGATLVSSTPGKDGSTELNVVGLGGDFSIAWHNPNPQAAESPAVLESTAAVLTRLDGRSVSAEATLTVRSHGAAFDRFVVRLPPGSELVPGTASGYLLTSIARDPEDRSDQRQIEVRLPKKTAGPIDIRVACRRSYEPMQSQAWCELAGFDVVGAARQWGFNAVAAGGDWQVLWGTSSDVRQTDQLPEALRRADMVAGFEYSVQPYLLSARLVPRKTRISVDPEYVLLVERDAVRLDGKLRYAIRGAKIATLDVAMPGWVVDEVGPDNVVAVDGVAQNAGTVAIPLVRPSSGAIEVQIRAHRVTAADAKALSVPLPQPQNGTVGPASIAVVAADNVELAPNSQAIEGLVRQRIAPPIKLPERQQDPLYYRGTGVVGVFAADFHVLPQRITVDVASQVTVGDHAADVEQRLSYTVAYEPVDRLTIVVPRELAAPKRLQVSCDGKPLAISAASDDPLDGRTTPTASLRVALPGPRIGTCELLVQYTTAIAEPMPQQPLPVTIPLSMPSEGHIAANSLSVKSPRNLRTMPRKGDWTVVNRDTSDSNGQASLLLAAAGATTRLDLDLRLESESSAGATTIDRAWIQSWLTITGRQDRAAYQLTTNRKDIEISLPSEAVLDQALVDGKRVERQAIDDNRWLVSLPGQREGRRLVIELRYHFPETGPLRGAISIGFPKVGPDAWVRRLFWQLVLPANDHLVVNPPGLISEFVWTWQGYFLGREPVAEQDDLEAWVGAAPRDPLPEQTNVYLFSALGDADGAEIRTAGRSLIVLFASGAALVFGLLLIYVPATRHPATLLVAGLAILSAGLIAPEPALLLAQAASLGLVLALVAGFLDRTARRGRPAGVRKEPPSSTMEVGSTRTPRPASNAGNSHASAGHASTVLPQAPGNADR